MELQKFKDAVSVAATGMTVVEGRAKGLCVQCKEPALPKCYSDAGRREYAISGMCEKCFDGMFAEEDDSLLGEFTPEGTKLLETLLDNVSFDDLTELQYASTGDGPWKLFIFDGEGFHSGGKWFRRGKMKYPDEEITIADAKKRVAFAIADNHEVRICDGGDELVFHSVAGSILYPDSGLNAFWDEIGS